MRLNLVSSEAIFTEAPFKSDKKFWFEHNTKSPLEKKGHWCNNFNNNNFNNNYFNSNNFNSINFNSNNFNDNNNKSELDGIYFQICDFLEKPWTANRSQKQSRDSEKSLTWVAANWIYKKQVNQ